MQNFILTLLLSFSPKMYANFQNGESCPTTNLDILIHSLTVKFQFTGTYGVHNQWHIGSILERYQRRCPNTHSTLQSQSLCYTKKTHQQNSAHELVNYQWVDKLKNLPMIHCTYPQFRNRSWNLAIQESTWRESFQLFLKKRQQLTWTSPRHLLHHQ